MSTLPLLGPKFRAFDANGDPLSGGKLYSYSAGTSTPLATYTTRAGNIANANPVVLDANGEADVWTTPGVLYKFVLENSLDVIQWTVDNVPSGAQESEETDAAGSVEPGGRLTLTSGMPVTTANVTGATTVLYVPYKHNKVPLYDGSKWVLHTIASELSQATSDTTKSPGAVASLGLYDMFVWNDSGTLRLSRGPPWFTLTTRGTGSGTTELELLDARRVNKYAISNGPAAQRGLYVGSVLADNDAFLVDSLALRFVWNAYHRVRRPMRATDAGGWTYSTTAWRLANGSASNALNVLLGLNEEPVTAELIGKVSTLAAVGGALVSIGIGLDSTSTNSASVGYHSTPAPGTVAVRLRAVYQGWPGLGFHALNWLEYGAGEYLNGEELETNTTTWTGTSSIETNGIWGEVMA